MGRLNLAGEKNKGQDCSTSSTASSSSSPPPPHLGLPVLLVNVGKVL